MTNNLPAKPPTAPGVPASEQDLVERLEALSKRKEIWTTLMSQQRNHPLYQRARQWLDSVDVDDPKAEFEGQLAALKVWGHLDKDFRDMVLAAKTVNKDRATSLQLEKERAKIAREIASRVIDRLENVDKMTEEERSKEIEALRRFLGRLGRIK